VENISSENDSVKTEQTMDVDTLRRLLHLQTIFSTAVIKAQEENRLLGIPNWYSINGKIISDQQIEQIAEQNKKK
jgi:hypothetical protein